MILRFTLTNISNNKVLATRGAGLKEFLYLEIHDSRGRKVDWVGRADSIVRHSRDFFRILAPKESVTFDEVISRNGSGGYALVAPGKYTVTAFYAISPADYYRPVAGDAVIPETDAVSIPVTFHICSRKKTAKPK